MYSLFKRMFLNSGAIITLQIAHRSSISSQVLYNSVRGFRTRCAEQSVCAINSNDDRVKSSEKGQAPERIGNHKLGKIGNTIDGNTSVCEKSPASNIRAVSKEDKLTHVDQDGKANMVDVGKKVPTERCAIASGKVWVGDKVITLIEENNMKKGDVLTTAQLAGIMGAKHTSLLIPLCHPISLTSVKVNLKVDSCNKSLIIVAEARTVGVTGVEMEALTAVSVAALTVYDMCKAVTHEMVISDVCLVSKSGGKRDFQQADI